jgi:hypothetical protein
MKATSDFDDDLPNTGKFPQSIQRLVRFFKLEYLRNRRMQLMLLGKSREFNHHIATAAAQSSLNYCNQKVSQMHSKKKKPPKTRSDLLLFPPKSNGCVNLTGSSSLFNTPSKATRPPYRRLFTECKRSAPPATSTTISTPTPLVSLSASEDQSGVEQ